MAKIPYRIIPGKLVASVALVALLGAGAASLTLEQIAGHEGYVPEAYLDPVGIWTKCFGDIYDVIPGESYTFEQCLRSLNNNVERHAKPIFDCIPSLRTMPDKTKAAMVSMAYNIGTNGFCSSSVARYAKAGEWERACLRMSEIYTTAKGKKMPGLVKRRKAESQLCLQGLAEIDAIESKEKADAGYSY